MLDTSASTEIKLILKSLYDRMEDILLEIEEKDKFENEKEKMKN